jgi:hypothetical protein
MQITNPPQSVPYITTIGLQKIEVQVLDIGPWNMDLATDVGVAHGLGARWVNIIGVQAWIRDDADTVWYPLHRFVNSGGVGNIEGGISYINNTEIDLQRRTGGTFDFVTYDGVGISRGKVIIWVLV